MAYTSKDLQRAANITVRQMDHWYRRGWLEPFDRPQGSGTGIPLEWPERTVRKAIFMSNLINVGFRPERAHYIVEDYRRWNPTPSCPYILKIGNGLSLVFREGPG